MKTYERLRVIVQETGCKHKELAEKCGYNSVDFSRILNGRKPILDSDIIKLCKGLDIRPNILLGFDETA